MIRQAQGACMAAQAKISKADNVIHQCNTKAADATAQVNAAFVKRATQTADMRAKIEEQLSDTEAAILEGEKKAFKLRNGLIAAEGASGDPAVALAAQTNIDKTEAMLEK